VRHPHRRLRQVDEVLAPRDRHAVARARAHPQHRVHRAGFGHQREPLVAAHLGEDVAASVLEPRQETPAVGDERDDQVGLAIAVLGHAQPEHLGVRAQPPDHRLGRFALEADHPGAQRVLEPRQRLLVRLGHGRQRGEQGSPARPAPRPARASMRKRANIVCLPS
jgi:hypothetical protein